MADMSHLKVKHAEIVGEIQKAERALAQFF